MTDAKPATGTEVIRTAVYARRSRLVALARDAGISVMRLDSFMSGKVDLPADVLQGLTNEIWSGHIEYDAERDLIGPRDGEPPRSIGIPPQLTMKLPQYTPGPAQRAHTLAVPAPKPKPRPGWKRIW